MSAEPISQREFDKYVALTSDAILAIKEQGQETLDVLKELVIRNDMERAELHREIKQIKLDVIDLKEKATAGEKVDSFWLTIKKYLIYVLLGALATIGGYYGNKLVSHQEQEVKKVIVE